MYKRRFPRLSALTLALLMLTGCNRDAAQTDVSESNKTVTISGSLGYREPIDFPESSIAIVELRRQRDPALQQCHDERIAEQRISLAGKQVPIKFNLEVSRKNLSPGCDHSVVGAVQFAGGLHWASSQIPVATYSGNTTEIDAGVISLQQRRPRLFASHMVCGDQPVIINPDRNRLRVIINDHNLSLVPALSASGAKYVDESNGNTFFRNDGVHAGISIDGRELPECTVMPTMLPLNGFGHEPEWKITITAQTLALQGLLPQFNREIPTPQVSSSASGYRYETGSGKDSVAVEVRQAICTDSMSGMPYPLQMELTIGKESWHGCGGAPEWFLTAGVWVAEDIASGGIVDRSYISMDFRPDGTLSGQTGCNSYRATWKLTGEGILIDRPVTTRKSCAPSLNDQEDRFLNILSGAMRLHVDETSALVIYDRNNNTIKARLQ